MKFDKEFVMKNRFWMLLGVAMPMALVTLFLLFTSVTAGIDEKRAEIEKQLSELESALKGELRNEKWIQEKKAEADKLKAQEDEVWKNAYFAQDFLASWPKAFEDQFHYSDGLFARVIELQKKVDNEKELFKADTPADDGKTFVGILEKFEEDYILVKGLDADKELETRRFQRAEEAKVTIEGAPKAFYRDLQGKEGYAIKIGYEKSRYFDDPLTENEIKAFVNSYKDQIPEILAMVEPVNAKGEGVVQLRGWPYVKGQIPSVEGSVSFLRYKPNPENWDRNSKMISTEAWIAQEDLWVQREIYRMVRQANDYVSKFQGKGGTALKKPYVFTNPNWKVEVTWLGGKDVEFKVYNQLSRRQKVDIPFRIITNKNLPGGELVHPPVEPLSPKGSRGQDHYVGKHTLAAVPQGIFGVEQVLNWETAAVKRIDFISIGSPQEVSHGHRTLPRGYKPLKPPAVAAAVPTEGGEPGTTAPPGEAQAAPGPTGRSGFGEQGAQLTNVSPNGFVLDRYVDVMREARRIPVAIVLIVDQEHVDRVQTSFTNSKLRFLMTQCLMSRYPFSLRPSLNTETQLAAGGSSAFTPGPGPMPSSGPGEGGFRGEGGSPRGQLGFGGEASPGGTPPIAGVPGPGEGGQSGMPLSPTEGAVDDTEANVELVIYGIVTLYQRYPARPAEAPAPTEQPKELPKDAAP